MNLETLANKAVALIVPALKSKAISKITGDFSEAINNEILIMWDKIKPIFIQSDNAKAEIVQNIEKSQTEGDIDSFDNFLLEQLKINSKLKETLTKEITNIEKKHPSLKQISSEGNITNYEKINKQVNNPYIEGDFKM